MRHSFSLHRPSGAHEARMRYALSGRLLFSAPADRGARTASAGSPLTGGSFSAPADRGARTASACSFYPGGTFFLHRLCGVLELRRRFALTGGEFFAEPQRGIAFCGARETAASAAGTKRKGHLRFPFLFELLPFPCFPIWRQSESGDRFEKGNCSRVTVVCLSQPIRSSQIAYCYTDGFIYAGAT